MTIGELNRRISVLELFEKVDEYGQIIGEWQVVGKVWAKITPLTGSENLLDKTVKSTQNYKLTIRFYAGIDVTNRIQYLDNILEITAIKDIETGHRWTEITAKEI